MDPGGLTIEADSANFDKGVGAARTAELDDSDVDGAIEIVNEEAPRRLAAALDAGREEKRELTVVAQYTKSGRLLEAAARLRRLLQFDAAAQTLLFSEAVRCLPSWNSIVRLAPRVAHAFLVVALHASFVFSSALPARVARWTLGSACQSTLCTAALLECWDALQKCFRPGREGATSIGQAEARRARTTRKFRSAACMLCASALVPKPLLAVHLLTQAFSGLVDAAVATAASATPAVCAALARLCATGGGRCRLALLRAAATPTHGGLRVQATVQREEGTDWHVSSLDYVPTHSNVGAHFDCGDNGDDAAIFLCQDGEANTAVYGCADHATESVPAEAAAPLSLGPEGRSCAVLSEGTRRASQEPF